MSESRQAPASGMGVYERLTALVGSPVRLTLLDAATRERLTRIPGLHSQVDQAEIVIDCLTVIPLMREGMLVAVEAVAPDGTCWYTTSALPAVPGRREQLRLKHPDAVQTRQRRRYPRVDLDLPFQLLRAGGERLDVTLRDLSAGGASLQVEEELMPGERIRMVGSLGSGLFFEKLEAEVLRIATHPTGGWLVALQFHCDEERRSALAAWVGRRLHEGFAPTPE